MSDSNAEDASPEPATELADDGNNKYHASDSLIEASSSSSESLEGEAEEEEEQALSKEEGDQAEGTAAEVVGNGGAAEQREPASGGEDEWDPADEEGNQESLRASWQFASVIQFARLFAQVRTGYFDKKKRVLPVHLFRFCNLPTHIHTSSTLPGR